MARTSRLVAAALAAVALACGGTPNYYRKATSMREACCQALADPTARQSCLDKIERIGDPKAEQSSVNQATFRCVAKRFVCDRSNGQATRDSAQEQLNCLNALETGANP